MAPQEARIALSLRALIHIHRLASGVHLFVGSLSFSDHFQVNNDADSKIIENLRRHYDK